MIEGCKTNDRKCQEKLYMKMYPMLLSLCKRFFDDKHDILSALNNGMLKVFKNIEQYNSAQAELNTWVYSIVRNEALTMVRNQKSIMLTQELTDYVAEEIKVNPFGKYSEDSITYSLNKLPQITRAAFHLFYFEGYSIKEIGGALDIKEGTVKWHLFEGRKKLQQFFNNKGTRIANTG